MNKQLNIFILLLSIITLLVSACTSTAVNTPPSENNNQIIITETYTPTSLPTTTPTNLPSATPSHTPTATYTPNPTSTPTSTATALPTETPDLAKFGFEEYVHPSGKFKLEIAGRDTQVVEFEDAVFFTDGFHFIMAGFTLQEYLLDEENWITVTESFLDQFLIEWSAITSYDGLELQESEDKNSYTMSFDYFSEESPIQEGSGEILFVQQDDILYGLVLLTPEYQDVEFVWEIVKNSFMPIKE